MRAIAFSAAMSGNRTGLITAPSDSARASGAAHRQIPHPRADARRKSSPESRCACRGWSNPRRARNPPRGGAKKPDRADRGRRSRSSVSAASRTERVSGPTWSRLKPSGSTPKRLTRPYVGLSPTVPQNDAGIRIEPPVSLPIAMNTIWVATAAPDPPLDPPGLCCGFHGLRTAPKCGLADVIP